MRGATAAEGVGLDLTNISIHAPREGGDLDTIGFDNPMEEFQSTPPVRGATLLLVGRMT